MEAQKKNRVRISFIISLVISLALLGWWVAVNMAMFSTIILHPHNSISHAQRQLNSKVWIPPASYKPLHYVFFNGNDSYGLIPANQDLNVRQFSIAFWTKNDGPTPGSFDRPIEMLEWLKNSSGETIPYGWAFDAGDESKIGIDKIRFTVGSTSGNLFITNHVTVPANSWTHIVGTFDGTTLKLYQNGALVDSFPFKGSYSYHTAPLPTQLAIGWLPHHYWTGDLSDIRIYGRPLSPPEVNSIFHGQNISNGLIGWWKLNEGSGSLILESSRHSNNGMLHNPTWR